MPIVSGTKQKWESKARERSVFVFGDALKLEINPAKVTEINDNDIKKILNFIIKDFKYNVEGLNEIYFLPYRCKNFGLAELLKPVCEYLKLKLKSVTHDTLGSPLVSREKDISQKLHPISTIYDNKDNIVCVAHINTNTNLFLKSEPSIGSLCSEEVCVQLKDLQVYMMTTSTRFGILGDGYYLILVEFDKDYKYDSETESKPKLSKNEKLEIPFKTKILDVTSSCPSFFEAVVYFLYKARRNVDGKEFYKRIPPPLILENVVDPPSNYAPYNPYDSTAIYIKSDPEDVTGCVPEDVDSNETGTEDEADEKIRIKRPRLTNYKPVYIEPGVLTLTGLPGVTPLESESEDYTSYKVKAGYLKDVLLERIPDDEDVVVRISDAIPGEGKGSLYKQERDIVKTLLDCKDFNNIYHNHKEIIVQYFRGFGPVERGYAIISKFIEPTEPPKTFEIYKQLKQQLEILHKAGIIYHDRKHYETTSLVPEYNMIGDKPYLTKFEYSISTDKLDPQRVSQAFDWELTSLNQYFHDILKENGLAIETKVFNPLTRRDIISVEYFEQVE